MTIAAPLTALGAWSLVILAAGGAFPAGNRWAQEQQDASAGDTSLSAAVGRALGAARAVSLREGIQDADDLANAQGGGLVAPSAGQRDITAPLQVESNAKLQREGQHAPPRHFFVPPGGNDTGSGTQRGPFGSLGAARDAIRTLPAARRRGQRIEVRIRSGTYFLKRPFTIDAGGYAFKVDTPGAFKADHNLVWSTTGKVIGAQDRFPSRLYEPNEPVLSWKQWQALGYDRHSMVADPGFKDPEDGDFRLPEDSPAIQAGFKKPFAFDQVGPRR